MNKIKNLLSGTTSLTKLLAMVLFFAAVIFCMAILLTPFASVYKDFQFSLWLLFISCLFSALVVFLLIPSINLLYKPNVENIVFIANIFFVIVVIDLISISITILSQQKAVNSGQWLLLFSCDVLGIAALFSCLLLYSSRFQWLRNFIKRKVYKIYKSDDTMEYRFEKLIKAEIDEKKLKRLLGKNESDNLLEAELRESLKDILNQHFIKHKSIKNILINTIKYKLIEFLRGDAIDLAIQRLIDKLKIDEKKASSGSPEKPEEIREPGETGRRRSAR